MHPLNTQRGLPYKADPDAVADRARLKQTQASRERRLKLERHQAAMAEAREQNKRKRNTTAMREEGRRRDQVETCYRQHTPPQIRFASGMMECPK